MPGPAIWPHVGPWIGGFQPAGSPEPGGNWQWVTGEPFVYANWSDNEPNNFDGREHVLHYYHWDPPHNLPRWNDAWEDEHFAGYVVEWVPEPTTVSLLALGALAVLKRRRKR